MMTTTQQDPNTASKLNKLSIGYFDPENDIVYVKINDFWGDPTGTSVMFNLLITRYFFNLPNVNLVSASPEYKKI